VPGVVLQNHELGWLLGALRHAEQGTHTQARHVGLLEYLVAQSDGIGDLFRFLGEQSRRHKVARLVGQIARQRHGLGDDGTPRGAAAARLDASRGDYDRDTVERGSRRLVVGFVPLVHVGSQQGALRQCLCQLVASPAVHGGQHGMVAPHTQSARRLG